GHSGISGRNNLANVNRTKNAGITYRLVELGFGTNKDNAKVLTEDVETYAKRLVKTLTGTTNDKKPSSSKPKPSTAKPSKSKTIAQMADDEGFLSLVVPVKVLTNLLAYVSTSSVITFALSLFVPKPSSTNLYVIPAFFVRLTLARILRPLIPACPLWL